MEVALLGGGGRYLRCASLQISPNWCKTGKTCGVHSDLRTHNSSWSRWACLTLEALGRKIKKGVTREEELESLMGSGVRSQEATHQFSSLSRVPRTPVFPLGALGDKVGER